MLNLNQNQYSDFLNITNKAFLPLKNFVNEKEYKSILNYQKINKKFFPLPILFGLKKKDYKKIKDKKKVSLEYRGYKVASICKLKFFKINKNNYGKKIYGKNFLKHPYFKEFNKYFIFLSFKISKIFNYNKNTSYFISPKQFKKKINNKNCNNLASFHTRNVPHLAHQWIHKYLFNLSGSLLIQPLIGQYKKGEYKDKIIMKLNRLAAKSYKNKNIFVIPFYSYPRYGGPLEAALHAIVRKNYGCKSVWIGRDHAGYKNFFKKYDSQNYCKKKMKSLGIKIIAENEPYFCKSKNKILNNCNCKKNCKILISGSKIRSLIKNSKKISSTFMNEDLSKLLNKKTLVS